MINDKDTYYTIYAKDPDGKRIYPIRFIKHDSIYEYDMDTMPSLLNAGAYSYGDIEFRYTPSRTLCSESQPSNALCMTYGSKPRCSRLEYLESKYGMHGDGYEIECSNSLPEGAMNYLLYIEE